MSISINRMMVQGNLGKDPISHTFQPSGKVKVELSIATNSKWRNASGQEIHQTEWHNVVLWGKQAEVAAKYLKKGDLVMAIGPIETRSWDKDGKTLYRKEIRAREFSFQTRERAPVDNQPAQPESTEDESGYVQEPDPQELPDERIPF